MGKDKFKFGGRPERHFLKVDFFLRLLRSRRYRWIRHVIGHLLLLSFLFFCKKWGKYQESYDCIDWLFYNLLFVALFYLNIYVLIPRILFKGKSLLYFFFLATAIGGAIALSTLFEIHVLDLHRTIIDGNPIREEYTISQTKEQFTFTKFMLVLTGIFVLIFFSTALKFFQRWIKDLEKMNTLAREVELSEFTALQGQVNPHFLFNMLNSINVLAKTDASHVSVLIVKLADFLRYLVYDSNRTLVPLLTEIQFIQDYLDMEKVRRDDFVYSLHYDVSAVKDQQIPPQIVLILIENAIKHSHDPVDRSFIHIRFCFAGNRILMQICNSFTQFSTMHKGPKGSGLLNLKRRLYLLYGKNYRLRFKKKNNVFTATLSLPMIKKSI